MKCEKNINSKANIVKYILASPVLPTIVELTRQPSVGSSKAIRSSSSSCYSCESSWNPPRLVIMTTPVRDRRGTSPCARATTTPSRDSSGATHYVHRNRKAGHCRCHVLVLPLVLRVALLPLGANGRGVGKSIRGPCSGRRWRCRWVVSPGGGPSPARVSGP